MRTLTRARFTCPFYQIRFYPFGTQTCSFHMFISGTDNALTRLLPVSIIYSGKSQVGQYQGLDTSLPIAPSNESNEY